MRAPFHLCIAVLKFSFSSGVFKLKGQTSEQNQACLRCHTSQTFFFITIGLKGRERRLMNPLYILDSLKFAMGVHSTFNCIDCHSMEYETYPHNGELKLEPLMTCIDCHGGDETYASWNFDEIEEEFHKSVHYEIYGDQFSCSKCHSQHYYRPVATTSSSLQEIVQADNAMCLSCHDNMARYQLVSDTANLQVVQIHDWLPNQELHFRRVRCIECHTQVKDSLLVSHNIMRKEHATRNCVECHSANSILQASLYKYQNLQSRSAESGFLAGFVAGNTNFSTEYYVIGASRIPYLNLIYAVIFFATLGGILVHTIMRVLKK
jgi:hypothetical protein